MKKGKGRCRHPETAERTAVRTQKGFQWPRNRGGTAKWKQQLGAHQAWARRKDG